MKASHFLQAPLRRRPTAAVALLQAWLVFAPAVASDPPPAADSGEAARSYPSHLYVERDARLTSLTYGMIEVVTVNVGDRVLKGQPVLVVGSDLATGEFKVAEQEHLLAQAEYDRVRALHETDRASAHEVRIAQLRVEVAKNRRDLVHAQLERCTVRTPFHGTIAERSAVIGERIREGDPPAMVRLVADGPYRARVDVPESQLGGLSVGARAWVRVAAAGGEPFPARITSVAPVIDPASGTGPVIVELEPAEDPALKVGAAVHVRFAGGSH